MTMLGCHRKGAEETHTQVLMHAKMEVMQAQPPPPRVAMETEQVVQVISTGGSADARAFPHPTQPSPTKQRAHGLCSHKLSPQGVSRGPKAPAAMSLVLRGCPTPCEGRREVSDAPTPTWKLFLPEFSSTCAFQARCDSRATTTPRAPMGGWRSEGA